MPALKIAAALLALLSAASASAAERKPDLGDTAQGVYHGEVISDARGSSRSDVTLTVTRTGVNTVQVVSDYGRLPTFTAKLAKYQNTIQKTGPGGQVFLLDLSQSPRKLDVTDDDASWSGFRSTDK